MSAGHFGDELARNPDNCFSLSAAPPGLEIILWDTFPRLKPWAIVGRLFGGLDLALLKSALNVRRRQTAPCRAPPPCP
jgi:hypothetical protein